MDIWNLENIIFNGERVDWIPGVNLMRTGEGQFFVIQAGGYPSVLRGYNYTLIRNVYAPVFSELADQLRMQPAVIYDRVKNTYNEDYTELIVVNTITPETIRNEDSSGLKAWTYQGSLFVSGALKKKLEDASEGDLHFQHGFEWWG